MAMEKTLNLGQLAVGAPATIVRISGASSLAQRLIEIGLRPGVLVEVTQKSNHMVLCAFDRSSVALRAEEAACVMVESR